MSPSTQQHLPAAEDPRSRLGARQGFSLVEVIIVLAVMAVIMTFAVPNVLQIVRQARLNTYLQEFAGQMQRARQEAIRLGFPVVMQRDTANGFVRTFADVDSETVSGFIYAPNAGVAKGLADFEISRLELPFVNNIQHMRFEGPTDGPAGADSTDGMTTDGNGDQVMVFRPDGSIQDVGAFRLADFRQVNFFEVRVAPAATARIQILKYREDPPFGATGFYPRGRSVDGDQLWEWK